MPQDESVDSESALYGNDDSGFEYNPVKPKTKQRQRKTNDEDDCKVVYEKDLKKRSPKVMVEESEEKQYEDDRVLHTSFHISPYAINLISMIKRSYITKQDGDLKVSSRPKVLLDVTSSSIISFFELMKDNYLKISNINQLASEINASSGKVSIIQSKLKIDMGSEEEYERVDALIMSSVITRIKMMSEEFGVSSSCIAEFLIYMYVSDSNNKIFIESKKYCTERMKLFKDQLENFINESTQPNIEDENALKRLAFKMAALDIIESTRNNNNFKDSFSNTINTELGSDYNINAKIVLRKKDGKRHGEHNSNGIFKQKTGRKSEKSETKT